MKNSQMIGQMPGKKIVVVGDIMLDRFISGDVSRISPEAPVPVLSFKDEMIVPGGAANVARNLTRFGVQVSLIGITGDDQNADLLRQSLAEENGIALKAIKDSKRPTTVKTRFTSAGQQMLRVDHEKSLPLTQSLYKKLIQSVDTALAKADLLIISDYNKGVIDHSTAQEITTRAKKAGVKVIADPKKLDPSTYRNCDLITPNIHEFKQMTGLVLESHKDVIAAAKDMIRSHQIKLILVTMGADGMMLVADDLKDAKHITSQAKSVFDVSGAGDTVIATLAAAIACGGDLADATELANTAAGVVVGKAGTATVLPGEILAQTEPSYTLSESDVISMVKIWRDAGLVVGFTNGCFDLLHPGHLWVLEKAAATCDRLIVGLNSDRSTRKLKGEGRPHQTEDIRAAVLASLDAVDAVVVFDTPTPAKIIKAIAPDRLIKGGDYKAEDVVGRDTVIAQGGKVVIIPTKPGFSTTRLGGA